MMKENLISLSILPVLPSISNITDQMRKKKKPRISKKHFQENKTKIVSIPSKVFPEMPIRPILANKADSPQARVSQVISDR